MNWVARSLAIKRTYSIGLLLPDFTHPFFAEIAKAVAETVRAHGYHVIIAYFEEDPEWESREVDALLMRQVDGLIMASAQSSDDLRMFDRIAGRKVPFVLIDRPIRGLNATFVGVDSEAIGKLATEHLIAQGCQRIAHLRGPDVSIAAGRLAGYRRSLAKHGLSANSRFIMGGSRRAFRAETGYEEMRQLLSQHPRPDGVFCYNDPVAIRAIKAARDAGLDVPRDICVAGAGNVLYSDLLAVPLTTVDQGTVQTGRKAAELLLAQIESKRAVRPRRILLSPKLVVRQSSRRNARD